LPFCPCFFPVSPARCLFLPPSDILLSRDPPAVVLDMFFFNGTYRGVGLSCSILLLHLLCRLIYDVFSPWVFLAKPSSSLCLLMASGLSYDFYRASGGVIDPPLFLSRCRTPCDNARLFFYFFWRPLVISDCQKNFPFLPPFFFPPSMSLGSLWIPAAYGFSPTFFCSDDSGACFFP